MSAYQVIEGSAASSVVLRVPHGSRHVPADVRAGLLLDDAALETELDLMTDAHTGPIATLAAEAAARRPWIFENRTSRLVIDPERFPDEREEMREVGMGAVYTKTSHGEPLRREDPQDERRLLTVFFHPYAQAMTDLVDDRLAATGRAVIIDVHSYPAKPLPYELHAQGARPAVCIGTDAFHTPGWLLNAARSAFASCGDVERDTPFAGCYVPLRHFNVRPEVSAIMVELRRDTYLTGPVDARGRLARALARLVDLSDERHSRTEHR